MTYYELWLDAVKKLDHNEITLGEYEKMIAPLHREVDTLDKIRAEIDELDRYYDNDYFSTNNCPMYKCNEVLLIIDKYRAERSE